MIEASVSSALLFASFVVESLLDRPVSCESWTKTHRSRVDQTRAVRMPVIVRFRMDATIGVTFPSRRCFSVDALPPR